MGQADYLPAGPPPGHGDHFYYFEVYAVGENPELPPGLDRESLIKRIDPHILEQARIVGVYGR